MCPTPSNIDMMTEYNYKDILEYNIQVSISDEAFVPHNMPESFLKVFVMSAKSIGYTSVLHMLATCNITNKTVNSIYPME